MIRLIITHYENLEDIKHARSIEGIEILIPGYKNH
jgi:hypothetical protein